MLFHVIVKMHHQLAKNTETKFVMELGGVILICIFEWMMSANILSS